MSDQDDQAHVEADAELVQKNLYVNGFTVSYGNSDVVLKCLRNGEHILTMNMSFTLAKTLSQILGTTVQNVESVTGMDIKTTRDIDEALAKHFSVEKSEQ